MAKNDGQVQRADERQRLRNLGIRSDRAMWQKKQLQNSFFGAKRFLYNPILLEYSTDFSACSVIKSIFWE